MSSNPFEKFDKPSEYLPEGKDESFYLNKIQARIEPKSKVKNLIRPSWMIGIAASLFLVSIYFMLEMGTSRPEQLAVSSFYAYKNYKIEKTRGKLDENDLDKAYESYDEEEYFVAERQFQVFEGLLSPLDQLYYSITLIANGKFVDAELILSEIESQIPAEHKNAWLFYSALCDLSKSNSKSALLNLEKVIDDKSNLSKVAIDLITKLD